MQKILLIIVIIIVGLSVFYYTKVNFGNTAQTVTVANTNITDNSASVKYSIVVNYPQISGLNNPETQQIINTNIKKQMEENILSFKKKVNETEQELAQNPNITADIEKATNTFNINYQTSQADNNIASFVFNITDYQAGDAHPNVYNQVFNFDVKNKTNLQLSDLFKPGSDYIQTLSNIASTDLIAQAGDDDFAKYMIAQGASPKAENFNLFNLTSENLVLIFNPYQVASGAAGTKIVTIPLHDLKDILKPQFLPN